VITGAMDPANRIQAGRGLLALFLADGRIRGLTPDAEVYDHHVDAALCERFLSGLRKISVKGTA